MLERPHDMPSDIRCQSLGSTNTYAVVAVILLLFMMFLWTNLRFGHALTYAT